MISLLLLDLDGVIVFEMAPPHVKTLELIHLHDTLLPGLNALGVPVVVLTHRSRAEAAVILESAGLQRDIAGLIAAEDILRAALAHGTPWRLLRRGLLKSWALPVVERQYRVARKNIAFVDDRLDNIQDLIEHGVGLALHVPSEIKDDGSLVSFRFEEVTHIIRHWSNSSTAGSPTITPHVLVPSDWHRTGLNTGTFAISPFNRARRFGRSFRDLLWSRSAI